MTALERFLPEEKPVGLLHGQRPRGGHGGTVLVGQPVGLGQQRRQTPMAACPVSLSHRRLSWSTSYRTRSMSCSEPASLAMVSQDLADVLVHQYTGEEAAEEYLAQLRDIRRPT